MDINLSLSPALGIPSNWLVVAVYEATALSTVVAFKAFAAPHASSQNIKFTGLNPATYYVVTYESPDGNAAGDVRHDFFYDPTWTSAQIRIDVVLICGVTSGFPAGSTSYSDTTYVGWTGRVERRGVGTLIDQAVQPIQAELQWLPAGGFQLLQEGDSFAAGEIVIVHFDPQISTATPIVSQTAGVLWSGELDITTDVTLTAANMGMYCIIAGAGPVVNITLPAGSAVPDGKMIAFLSEGGNHIAANLLPAAGDQLKWLNDTWTNSDPLSMCQSEYLCLAFHGNAWRVFNPFGAWQSVGLIYTDFTLASNPGVTNLRQNVVAAGGALFNCSYYPRLWRWINKRLDPSMLVTDTQWNTQDLTGTSATYKLYPWQGRYSTGTGSLGTNFRVPLLQRAVDAQTPANIRCRGYLQGVSGAGGADLAGVIHKDSVGTFLFGVPYTKIKKSGADTLIGVSAAVNDVSFGIVTPTPSQGQPLPQGVYAVTGYDPVTYAPNGATEPFSTQVYFNIQF